ncbi:methyltransferase family protein [Lignipirellula cremea]|uniref:Isoprenylcysteine carboxyl methyltransferase (ICMT) family protein n=1 Tax=Lignipirellula cremea TaxID=2528010 RepID=A0A518E3I7_9BACT|nr:isoprenylcysteine carboxylmethyltransferase family protein [Lignipirellula cremea]QDU98654.1 Isoprenylcysteine carboxyl methyltransferase (ICMT) family protein [Lignipirellula cremea]
MFWRDLPQLTAVAAVWIYWSSVLVMVIRSHLRYKTQAGAVPHTAKEIAMWMIWVPAILLWQFVPTWANQAPPWAGEAAISFITAPVALTQTAALQPLRWMGALLAVAAFAATVHCWFFMGSNWSMAVVPSKDTGLITQGAFSRVRHPIYALSIVLMLGTLITAPSPAVAVLAAIHWTMLTLKTLSEEEFLLSSHGDSYARYMKRTGRFFPKLIVPAEAPVKAEPASPKARKSVVKRNAA